MSKAAIRSCDIRSRFFTRVHISGMRVTARYGEGVYTLYSSDSESEAS